MPCPSGADCRGPKIWSQVYAKYGYVGLGPEDYVHRKDSFWPCFKKSACLGGKTGPYDGETRASKHGYWVGPYNTPRDIWNTNTCSNNGDCLNFINAYPPIPKSTGSSSIFERSNEACCSGVDPLLEDGGPTLCKKDPSNFQSRFIKDGSLFVINLHWHTTEAELMAIFNEYQPKSVTMAMSIPSENIQRRIPLGWATISFEDNKIAKLAKDSVTHPMYNFSLGFDTRRRGCYIVRCYFYF